MIHQVDENGNKIEDEPDLFPGGGEKHLPDENVIFYAGISSAVLIMIFAPVAVALGAYVYLRAKKALIAYEADPVIYPQNSLNRVRTGISCGIIAMAVPVVLFVLFAIVWALVGLGSGHY